MRISYATQNDGKLISLQRDLKQYNIVVSQVNMDIPEPRSSDVQEIAQAKIQYAFDRLKQPIVVSDAGFYIHSLKGFPRAFVNFALETIDLEGMLTLVEGKERTCEFRECLAYLDTSLSEPKYFIGHVPGTIAKQPRGEMQDHLWSRLGLIFIPDGADKTLGEMTGEEYTAWRSKWRDKVAAGHLFGEWITNRP
ncbi:MAG: hypothetical protein KKG59_04865 [Nanoarchaeota archaeon]|nr:hypothetical protein [Nanoarchaeota archaeon]